MDLFDDILTDAPSTHAKPGGRFAPKAKPKQPPQKNVSASKDANNVIVASTTTHKESEGKISQSAVAVNSSTEESTRSGNQSDINVDNGRNKELPINGEGSFLDSNQSLEVVDKSLEVSLNMGFKSASGDSNTGVSENNIHSNFEFGEVGEVLSAEIELDPFSNVLPDFGTGNADKFKPKIKPRPRVGSTPTIASDSPGIPFSTDNRSFVAVIPSHLDSMNAMSSEAVVHDGTRDLSSSFGTSATETADLKSLNVKGTEENFVLPGYDNKSRLEAQEEADLNPDFPIDIAYDYQSMKSSTDPTSEIPRHEGLTNSVDSPTLADFLQQDCTGEKEDANERKRSLKKDKRSSIAGVADKGGKTSRETRKQAPRKPAKNSLNETVEDYDDLDPPYVIDRDELKENDDEDEVDHSPKRKRASTKSKKKSVAKNGKASEKSKKAIDVLEKDKKELPKKFSHSSRRKKRCVDKALLDDEFLDHRTLPIRDIILLAEYKEKLAKKEAAASKTSSTNQSEGDFFHDNDANNEDEFYGSDDGFRDQYTDQAREKITSNTPLYNSHSFMDKAPRGKWSAHDTEKFYEAVRQFGTDFYMIQELFPDKTHRQVVLKYKKEERQHPLLLSDALKNRSTDFSFYKLLIERQKQNSNKEEQDTKGDASDLMPGEEVEDPILGINEEIAPTLPEQDTIDVKDREDSVAEQSDDKQDELDIWSHYQSDI